MSPRPGEPRVVAPVETAPYVADTHGIPERPAAFDRSAAPAGAPSFNGHAANVAPAPPSVGAVPLDPVPTLQHADPTAPTAAGARPSMEPVARPSGHAADAPHPGDTHDTRPMCTTAQLRRFIKSRPWVPMHELRRRFGIWGTDDDVSPMRVGPHTLFIGLPPAESGMMAELLNAGDVGYELSLDPTTPIVVGVYPMRPVPRS